MIAKNEYRRIKYVMTRQSQVLDLSFGPEDLLAKNEAEVIRTSLFFQ